MDAHRKFDVVVFGATGFTGQRVLKELVSQGQGYDRDKLSLLYITVVLQTVSL